MDRLDDVYVAIGRWCARVWRATARGAVQFFRWHVGLLRAGMARREHERALRNASPWALPVVEPPPIMPYRRRASLLSLGEHAFWPALCLAVGDRYSLFTKVRLLDLVDHPPLQRGQPNWFKKIRGFHVDFVLCELVSLAPLLVIELDDRSHRSDRGVRNDQLKNAVLAAAGLRILRVPTAQAYSPDELRELIGRSVTHATRTSSR
jgi:hypothetical protein